MKLKSVVLTIALVLGLSTYAQTTKQGELPAISFTDTSRVPVGQIIGKDHPEQIPDQVAFRMFMSSVYPKTNANPNGSIHFGLVEQIGLSGPDMAVLIKSILTYHKNVDSLIDSYNTSAKNDASMGTSNANHDTLYRNIYGHASNTMTGLQAQMTPEGYQNFVAYLQKYKAGLKISPYDVGLGASAQIAGKERNMVAMEGMPGVAPQFMGQMAPNYSSAWTQTTSFPATSVANSPFYNGWTFDAHTYGGSYNNLGLTIVNPTDVTAPTGNIAYEGYMGQAYWTGGGSNINGTSTFIVNTPGIPSYYCHSSGIGCMGYDTDLCTRTNVVDYTNQTGYMACLSFRYQGLTKSSERKIVDLIIERAGADAVPVIKTVYQFRVANPIAAGDAVTLTTFGGNVIALYAPGPNNSDTTDGAVVLTWTDSSPLPAGYVGVAISASANTTPGSISNWTGGTGLDSVITGTITGNTEPCTQMCVYAGHQPQFYATMGNSTVNSSGPTVTPPTEVDWSGQLAYDISDPFSDPLDYSFEVEIYCSAVGDFWSDGGSGSFSGIPILWVAETYLNFPSPKAPGPVVWECTTNSTPPDFAPRNVWTPVILTSIRYNTLGICNILGSVIPIVGGGLSCLPLPPAPSVNGVPPPGSALAFPQFLIPATLPGICTSGYGTINPVIVIKFGT